jgi:hypothetical protein
MSISRRLINSMIVLLTLLSVVAWVNPFAPDSQPTVGVKARIDALEKFVLGKTTKNSLEVRAQHLEKKLVPYEHNLASLDIEKRVDNLWGIMDKANVNVVTTPRLNEQ